MKLNQLQFGKCSLTVSAPVPADEISTGLDSSTTYEIVKFLGDTTTALGNTTLVALLQPAPETFELFTDVRPPPPPPSPPPCTCFRACWPERTGAAASIARCPRRTL